jgi:hypothetical protein
MARRVEQHRADLRSEFPGLPEKAVHREAESRLRDEIERLKAHPYALREFKRLEPSSRAPRNGGPVHEHVEAAAIRASWQGEELAVSLLRERIGRPADRKVVLALIERNIYGRGRKEIKCHYNDLFTDDRLLHWAYGEPLGPDGGSARSLKATYRTAGAALYRSDPEITVKLNIEALRELRDLGHDDVGRYLAVDGVAVEGNFEQRAAVSDGEELLLRRGSDAAFVVHKGLDRPAKAWRGWTAVVLVDLKTNCPVAWVERPANVHESESLLAALDVLFDYWPDCPTEYVVGDRAYDSSPLILELERNYGIHGVFPLRNIAAEAIVHRDTLGVPACSKHGLMKRIQADDFVGPSRRRHLNLTRGMAAGQEFRPRIRWKCESCPDQVTYTRPTDNARFYTFLPHLGDSKQAGLRMALRAHRNQAESLFSSLENCGFCLKGQWKSKWANEAHRVSWLIGGGLLAHTMRRLTFENGEYERVLNEAESLGVIL